MKKRTVSSGFPRSLAAFFSILFLFVAMVPLMGCNDEEENIIEVCNNDNEDYRIKLHRDSDDVVVGEFSVDEFYMLTDRCDTFEDYPEGRYYLTIHEDGREEITDTSVTFYLDDDDEEYFYIDSTASIIRD